MEIPHSVAGPFSQGEVLETSMILMVGEPLIVVVEVIPLIPPIPLMMLVVG
jgi:hypothetical protein|tara:strand:+ start:119 stop:271 length:153 start_codon:yes stop_codon:yes gene_type:complete